MFSIKDIPKAVEQRGESVIILRRCDEGGENPQKAEMNRVPTPAPYVHDMKHVKRVIEASLCDKRLSAKKKSRGKKSRAAALPPGTRISIVIGKRKRAITKKKKTKPKQKAKTRKKTTKKNRGE